MLSYIKHQNILLYFFILCTFLFCIFFNFTICVASYNPNAPNQFATPVNYDPNGAASFLNQQQQTTPLISNGQQTKPRRARRTRNVAFGVCGAIVILILLAGIAYGVYYFIQTGRNGKIDGKQCRSATLATLRHYTGSVAPLHHTFF
jgi:hypothetical protein